MVPLFRGGRESRAVAPRARVAGEGAGGAGERRKLAPLAPFSRFAGAGLSAAEGGLAGGKSGRLEPWEGAPVVLRGVSVVSDRETAGVLGGDDALLGGSAPTRATGAATGSGGGGKRDRSDADGPAGEGDDAVAGLRERLAADDEVLVCSTGWIGFHPSPTGWMYLLALTC